VGVGQGKGVRYEVGRRTAQQLCALCVEGTQGSSWVMYVGWEAETCSSCMLQGDGWRLRSCLRAVLGK
jgi:hypothetical protein